MQISLSILPKCQTGFPGGGSDVVWRGGESGEMAPAFPPENETNEDHVPPWDTTTAGFFGLGPCQIAIALQRETSSFRDHRTQVLRARGAEAAATTAFCWGGVSRGPGGGSAFPSQSRPPCFVGEARGWGGELAVHLTKSLFLVPNT